MSLTLVIGGTRSGKSAHGERLAAASGLPVRYVATADGADPAMAERIAAHRARRPAGWHAVEADGSLRAALAERDGLCVLVDGLGTWIAGVLHRARAFEDPAALARVRTQVIEEMDALVETARDADPLIVVAEEAGHGLLPADAASRAWLDLLGEATQRLAAVAERVELVVAGRPLVLAGDAPALAGDALAPPIPPPSVPIAGAAPPTTESDLAALRRHGDGDVRPGDADHAVNVIAGGPPAWLREALHAALDKDTDRYPDERDACEALAALHGRAAAEIVPTNGAAEALWLLPAALRPRLAACVHPAFTEAEAALRAHGVPVARVQRDSERGFALDPAAIPDDADLVVLGNPASPSGTLDPAAALLALRRPGRVVVVDEAFMDLVPGEPASLVREPLGGVIVVRSLTKALAIPGLRAGYAVAAPALAERLRAVRPPWSCNALALAALAAAARRPAELAAAAERAQTERQDLERRLAALPGVRTWPGAANFALVEVPDGPALVAALRKCAIAVRPAASFPGLGANHLRITARAPEQNARLVAALAEGLGATSSTREVAR